MRRFVVSALLSLLALPAISATNFREDSYDLYVGNFKGDSEQEYLFVAKKKILILAGDVSIPIQYTDGDSFYVQNGAVIAGTGGIDYWNMTKRTDYGLEANDANGDGVSDITVTPPSGHVFNVLGSKTQQIASGTEFTKLVNSSTSNVATVKTDSGLAYKITRNGVTFLQDASGNPFNIEYTIKSANAIGNIKGDFTVSQGGAATYNLPIELVAGPAGIKPPVSINYYSQGGNGLLGKGWSLSATETITRCKPVGRATNAPNYTDADTLCLNGDELVVTHQSGGTNVYRKRIDDGSVVHANSSGFKVYDEKNNVKEFYAKQLKSGSSSVVKAWYLSKVTKPGGANYQLRYSMDNANGEVLLSKITYGAHKVEFSYQERPDRAYGYDSGGAKFARTKRLSQVLTYANSKSVSSYHLKYNYAQRVDQSYLTDIQKCVGSDCYEPLSFDWTTVDSNLVGSTQYTHTFPHINDSYLVGDVDGNGTADIISYDDQVSGSIGIVTSSFGSSIRLSGVNSRNSSGDPESVSLGHADSDGILDILYYENQVSAQARTLQSYGKFQAGTVASSKDVRGWASRFTDVNGDGISDFIQYDSSTTVNVYTGDGTGGYFGPKAVSKPKHHDIYFGDFNGDGKSDILFYREGRLQIRFGGGGATSASYSNSADATLSEISGFVLLTNNSTLDIQDVNGDGLDDIVFSQVGFFNVYRSLGNKIDSSPVTTSYSEKLIGENRTNYFADVNHDGRSDVVYRGSNGYSAYRLGQIDGSFGAEQSAPVLGYIDDDGADGGKDGQTAGVSFADLNGDGTADMIRYGATEDHIIHYRYGTKTDLRITAFQDSYDQTTAVEYKTMADPSVYTRATPSWFKKGVGASINSSTFLVSKTTDPEGDTYFKYGGAQNSLDDGYLGFQLFTSITDRDHSNITGNTAKRSIVSATYMDQTNELLGKQYQVYKRTFAGSAQENHDKVVISGDAVLTAKYGTDDLFSGSILPLAEITASVGSDGSVVTRAATRSASSISSGVSAVTNANSSIHKESWEAIELANGVVRPVLTESSMTYRDWDNFNDEITQTTTRYTYELLANGSIVRPTIISIEEGVGDFVKTTTNTNDAFLSGDTTNPEEIYGAFLPTKQTLSTAASGAWVTQLTNEGLETSDTDTKHLNYYTSGSTKYLPKKIWATDRADEELITTLSYDAVGNIIKTSVDSNDETRTGFWIYDANTGNLLSTTNAVGHMTTYDNFDKYGNPGSVTVGAANSSMQDLTINYQYDSFGRLVKEAKPSGEVVTTSYHNCTSSLVGCDNEAGYKIYVQVQSSTGAESFTFYDKRGLKTKTIGEDFGSGYIVSTATFDAHHRAVATSLPKEVSSLGAAASTTKQEAAYDILDLKVRSTDSNGGEITYQWAYEGNGVNKRTVSVKVDDTFTRDTVETYNSLDQLIKVENVNGTVTQYLYDLDGNLVRQWYSVANYSAANPEANNGATKTTTHVIKNTYDELGRLIAEEDPNKGKTEYRYTPFSELAEVKTPRVLSGSVSKSQTFTYDKIGRTLSTTNADGSRCYYYDDSSAGKSLGQLTETRFYKGLNVTCNATNKVSGFYAQQLFSFNSKGLLEGREQTISGAGTFYSDFTYNNVGQLITKKWYGGDGGNVTASYAYDDHSGILESISAAGKTQWRLTDMDALGNARGVTLGGVVEVIKDYNQATGQMTGVSASLGAASLLNLDYSYNKQGFVTQLTDNSNTAGNWSSSTETYHYNDKAHRQLTSVDVSVAGASVTGAYQYTYDALGNIRSTKEMGTYSYNAANPHRVTQVGTNNYQYNADGSVTNDGRRNLTYGHNHLPVTINNGEAQTNYVYNADDTLLYREDSVKGSNGQYTVERKNWYFGDMQYTQKGSSIERVYTLAEGVTIVVDNGSGGTTEAQYSITNNIGSTVLTLNQDGSIKQRLKYDPLGKPSILYDSKSATSIMDWSGYTTKEGFTGHEHMYDLDLIHMKGRVYDPTIGRFLQADIIVQAPHQVLSYNRYAYVWNNPLANIDPSGYRVEEGSGYYHDPYKEYEAAMSAVGQSNLSGRKNNAPSRDDANTRREDELQRLAWLEDVMTGNLPPPLPGEPVFYMWNDDGKLVAVPGPSGGGLSDETWEKIGSLIGFGWDWSPFGSVGPIMEDLESGNYIGVGVGVGASFFPPLKYADKASDLPILSPGSSAWDKAVEAIRNALGHAAEAGHNFRVGNQKDAKAMVEEALEGIPRRKPQKGGDYGYEYHLGDEAGTVPFNNDLRHIKWYDWRDGKSGADGHVFFDDWK